jgi:hypothetical protein
MRALRRSRRHFQRAALAAPVEDPRLKLIYEEAIRGWSLQSSVLDELRNRAGVLLSAATVASAFLGSADLADHKTITTLGIIAIVAFGAVVVLCVSVLWPTGKWCFTHSASGLIGAYVKPGKPIDYMHEQMALATDEYRTKNDTRLARRFCAFRLAAIAVGADVVLWIIDLH